MLGGGGNWLSCDVVIWVPNQVMSETSGLWTAQSFQIRFESQLFLWSSLGQVIHHLSQLVSEMTTVSPYNILYCILEYASLLVCVMFSMTVLEINYFFLCSSPVTSQIKMSYPLTFSLYVSPCIFVCAWIWVTVNS